MWLITILAAGLSAGEAGAAIAQATLVSPINGATGVAPCTTLRWNSASGATGYEYQLMIGGNVVASGGSGGPTELAVNLAENTTYCWRVRGRTSANNGPWSATWCLTTKPPIPAPALRSPDNGALNYSRNVTLQWTSIADATAYDYELYLGGAVVTFGSAPDVPNPSVDLRLLEGMYQWRVRGRTSCRAGAWSALWTFTIPPLSPPILTSPANGSAQGLNVMLTWNTAQGATGYDYEVYRDGALHLNSSGGSGIALTLAENSTYQWRVRSKTSERVSDWSSMWSFSVPRLLPPTLVGPSNGSAQGLNVNLSWNPAAGATGYDYEVYRNGALQVSDSGGSGIALTLAENSTYQWRVRSKTSARSSDWSGMWSFTVPPIAAPALVSPANGAPHIGQYVSLEWNPVFNATGYDYEVYDDGTLVSNGSGGSPVTVRLAENRTYQWRVRGKTSARTGAWSGFWSFNIPVIPPPVLVSPANGSAHIGLNVELRWNPAAGATGYDYEVYRATTLVRSGRANSGVVVTLEESQSYRWRVRGNTSERNGGWSGYWTFSIPGIPVPVQLTPVPTAILPDGRVTFTWEPAAGSTGYDYEVRGGGITRPGSGPSGTTLSLPVDTEYAWRVRGKTSARVGEWSPFRRFVVTELRLRVASSQSHSLPVFQFNTVPEFQYEILSSTDLLNWTSDAVIAATQASYTFSIPAGRPPKAFYRVKMFWNSDLLPDLFVARNALESMQWRLDTREQPGRTLLRLTTATPNIGKGPLEVHKQFNAQTQQTDAYQRIFRTDGSHWDRLAGEFEHHPTHNHDHFLEFMRFRLRAVLTGGGVGEVVRVGEKISFAMLDLDTYDLSLPGASDFGQYFDAGAVQGISVGWADVYDKSLPDQWIDITGVPPGNYWLEAEVDPVNRLLESNENNNVTRVQIELAP